MYFSFDYDPYISLIGDIRGSRLIKDRKETQKKLEAILKGINQKYGGDIVSKFTITLGDEFQGLLSSGTNVIKIITEIENRLHPVKMRFGIGVGEISTQINHDLAIGADGSSYYEARRAVEYLKQSEKKKQSAVADIRLEVFGRRQDSADLVNTILSLMSALERSWTGRQRQTIWAMLEEPDSQVNVAKRLGVQQSTVQKSLSGSHFYTYRGAMDILGKVLGEIRRADV